MLFKLPHLATAVRQTFALPLTLFMIMTQPLGQRFIIQWAAATAVALLTASVAMPALCPLWLSISQWVVLRRYMTRAWQWLLATVIGGYLAFTVLFLFAMLLGAYLDSSYPINNNWVADITVLSLLLAAFLLAGAIRSSIQCLTLTGQTAPYRQWIWTGAIATVVSLIAAAVLSHTVLPLGLEFSDVASELPLGWMAVWGLSGLLGGWIEARSLSQIFSSQAF